MKKKIELFVIVIASDTFILNIALVFRNKMDKMMMINGSSKNAFDDLNLLTICKYRVEDQRIFLTKVIEYFK